MSALVDYSLVRTEPPEEEPITTDEAKRHCNVVATDDDDYIDTLIAAAREKVETDANLSLITQAWRLRLHQWPCGTEIMLPRPPLVAVSEVEYIDANGDVQTWDDANYLVDVDRRPGRLFLHPDSSWPDLQAIANAVTITYEAGFGDEAADVPAAAKHAMKLLVGHWYRTREPEAIGTISGSIALTYQSLIQGLKPGRYL